ncbi:MAG: chemotaxis protein methyltransferase CheR [Rhizobacter sp.]|nr:chemotaxis protein methyltransferase CheR [Rhizobacter sp.]
MTSTPPRSSPPSTRFGASAASITVLDRLSPGERFWAAAIERLGDGICIGQYSPEDSCLELVYASGRLVDWLDGATDSAGIDAWRSLLERPDIPAAGDLDPGASRETEIVHPLRQTRWLRDRKLELDALPVAGIGVAAAQEARSQHRRIGLVVEDVTARRKADHELRATTEVAEKARLQAERLVASKDEFISVVSHDLRSPLNAIRGWAHVMKLSSDLSTAQERALDAIDRNITAQARMVDDLLDSQRILRGKLVLSFGQPALADLIDEAVETIRPAAQSKRITIEVLHDRSIGAVEADVERLRQSLSNLLSNSLKFTPEDGRIEIASSRAFATPGQGEVLRVKVSDTGMGLTAQQLEHVFDPVMRADQPSGRRQGGLNLPLSLARQLIEMHGGSLSALSEGVDAGLTMMVELPRAQNQRLGPGSG